MSAREKIFHEELDKLIEEGCDLSQALHYKVNPDHFKNMYFKNDQKQYDTLIQSLPYFEGQYEAWYSKSYKIIQFVLPDRLNDFITAYKNPVKSKELTFLNYSIHDYILGKHLIKADERPVMFNIYLQQLSILKAAKEMLSSKLFNLKALVQADLFDSEIDAARELAKKGFGRAAGAICGVIIEKHLLTLCQNHKIKIIKKNPTINDLCEPLKKEDIISQPDWRLIQYYADIRNLCCHNKDQEPTKEQIDDLINGTDKIIRTIS